MLYSLNNQRLLARDIKNFSKGNAVRHKKKESKISNSLKSIAKSLKNIVKSLARIVTVNLQLKAAIKIVNKSIKIDYRQFTATGEREKEDILIKWEGLGRTLNKHAAALPPVGSSIFTKGVARKSNEVIDTVNNFIDNLKDELYPNLNKPLSQDQMRVLAKKFEHLPKEMLEDLVSEDCP
jgi:hypothetical protein